MCIERAHIFSRLEKVNKKGEMEKWRETTTSGNVRGNRENLRRGEREGKNGEKREERRNASRLASRRRRVDNRHGGCPV